MSFFKLKNWDSNVHNNYKSIKKGSVSSNNREFLGANAEEQKHELDFPNMFSRKSAKLRAWLIWLICLLSRT